MHFTEVPLPRRPGRVPGLAGPAGRMACATFLMGGGLLGLSVLLAGHASPLPTMGFALVASISVGSMARGWTAPRLGAANLVTLARLALAMLVLLPALDPDLASGGTGWALFGIALLTLALDGIDGPLARRSGLAGPWGARFDMEVDSLFALILAIAVWRIGGAGSWVLLLGGMRYLFVLAAYALPWLNRPLPERVRRKAICVVQIATLIGLLAPLSIQPYSTVVAALALALLGLSFLLDILWLARRR